MKKKLISILAVIIALVAGLFIYAGTMVPKDFRITRSTVIQAKAFEIFPYVNNPEKMNSWNPWMKLDPDVKVKYSGPAEGVGAASEWDGLNPCKEPASWITV